MAVLTNRCIELPPARIRSLRDGPPGPTRLPLSVVEGRCEFALAAHGRQALRAESEVAPPVHWRADYRYAG